jgi:hypothetical protein
MNEYRQGQGPPSPAHHRQPLHQLRPVSTERLVVQEGHRPRPLHEKATTFTSRQASHRQAGTRSGATPRPE